MKVTLLNSANQQLIAKDDFFDSEYLAKQAAAICVDKLDNPSDKGFEKAIKSGHYSILEHLPLTFLIEDVSRALTHQLIRSKMESYIPKQEWDFLNCHLWLTNGG